MADTNAKRLDMIRRFYKLDGRKFYDTMIATDDLLWLVGQAEKLHEATPPADAALADALDNVGLAFDRNSQYATTMRKAASAIRARPQAVPKHINAVYFDVPAQPRSAYVMGWNDCIDSMLAASQSATGAK